MPSLLLSELTEAVRLAVQEEKGDRVALRQGKFLHQIEGLYLYQFVLESLASVPKEAIGKLQVAGKSYEADIIATRAPYVQIALKQKLNEPIGTVRFEDGAKNMLERLQTKFETHRNDVAKFAFSECLFQKPHAVRRSSDLAVNDTTLNVSQHQAVQASLKEKIAVIWGPPGTGKTATIAKAVDQHLRVGRKVLLLSHANTAVDQALLKVAEQSSDTYYERGQVLRLGTPKADMLTLLQKEYPLVLPELVLKHQSQKLYQEREMLQNRLRACELLEQTFSSILVKEKELEALHLNLNKTKQNGVTLAVKSKKLSNELAELHLREHNLNQKLDRAVNANAVMRFIKRLDPVDLRYGLERVSDQCQTVMREIEVLTKRQEETSQALTALEEKVVRESEVFQQLLSKVNKSIANIKAEISELSTQCAMLRQRLDLIAEELEMLKTQIFKQAKLIATTLSQSYLSKEVETLAFDVVIVDEVGMAPMPMLYWAATKADKGITLVGDFKQLPPISGSKEKLIKKWFGRSIFDHWGITDGKVAENYVYLLNTQYRMHPHISEIPRREIYHGLLEDHPSTWQKVRRDAVSNDAALCLVDTTPHNTWCTKLESGSRFNLISALVTVSLVEKMASAYGESESIGIITPYKAQANLIYKMVEDRGLFQHLPLKINTVHSFQGGEETVVIFDGVEGPGSGDWSLSADKSSKDAKRLINVMMTRAQSKLYIVSHVKHIEQTFSESELFREILNYTRLKGKSIQSTDILDSFFDENFDHSVFRLSEEQSGLVGRKDQVNVGFTHQDFWPNFYQDLNSVEREVLVLSPFLTRERFSKLRDMFERLKSKGVKIVVITLPLPEQPEPMRQGAAWVMQELQALGAILKFRRNMHEKIAILDRNIKWFGSLNILSHNTRREYMERFVSERLAQELLKKLGLNELI
ncbi:MAG: AAA domain-containing protein [Trueperaceae bacterium]